MVKDFIKFLKEKKEFEVRAIIDNLKDSMHKHASDLSCIQGYSVGVINSNLIFYHRILTINESELTVGDASFKSQFEELLISVESILETAMDSYNKEVDELKSNPEIYEQYLELIRTEESKDSTSKEP